MTIDRWSSMAGSSSPRSQVASGTPCSPCKARGHHCDAREIVNGRAVCLCCLDGVDCPKVPRGGVVDAPRPRALIVTSQRTLSPRECAGMRSFHKAGKSLGWLALEFGVPLTRVQEIVKESPAEEREEQRRSFAHGNVSMHNPDVTRAVIDKAAETLAALPPTTPQPALAPGAAPSAAMPARRVFAPYKGKVQARAKAKTMLSSGMSVKAAMAASGLGRNTVHKVRRELLGLVRPRKAAGMSAAAAEQVVAEAEAITAEVAGEIARRSVQPEVEAADTKQGDTKLTTANDVAVQAVPGLSAKSAAQGYRVVGLDDVPGRRPASVYEDIVADLAALPVNSAVMRTYANEGIAHTFMCGITRIARSRGVKVGQAKDGATIYVWRKA